MWRVILHPNVYCKSLQLTFDSHTAVIIIVKGVPATVVLAAGVALQAVGVGVTVALAISTASLRSAATITTVTPVCWKV